MYFANKIRLTIELVLLFSISPTAVRFKDSFDTYILERNYENSELVQLFKCGPNFHYPTC